MDGCFAPTLSTWIVFPNQFRTTTTPFCSEVLFLPAHALQPHASIPLTCPLLPLATLECSIRLTLLLTSPHTTVHNPQKAHFSSIPLVFPVIRSQPLVLRPALLLLFMRRAVCPTEQQPWLVWLAVVIIQLLLLREEVDFPPSLLQDPRPPRPAAGDGVRRWGSDAVVSRVLPPRGSPPSRVYEVSVFPALVLVPSPCGTVVTAY